MSAREELAAVLAEHEWQRTYLSGVMECSCGDSFKTGAGIGFEMHVADALLASPALARVIREAKAEAWDEAADYDTARAIVRGYEDQGEHIPNPYRKEQP